MGVTRSPCPRRISEGSRSTWWLPEEPPVDLTNDLALEEVDLLLKVGDHPQGVDGRLIGDILQSPQPRVRPGVLIHRDRGGDLDAIPAVRERNIRQVNPESGAGTGFFGPEGGVF